jgi:uncharacterized membrane protein YkvA (DUF1232 family)
LNNNNSDTLSLQLKSKSLNNGNSNIDQVILDEDKIKEKASREDVGRFKKLVNQLKLAIELIKDYRNKSYTEIPWRSIGLIAAAILYFFNPFDIIPDLLPIMGFADDAVLFAAVFKSIRTDLEKYAAWKGVDINEYF